MNEDVKTVAEPSAATPVIYDSWDDKGTPIVSKSEASPSKQDSAPAEPSEAKAESAAESEAAKSSQEKSHKPKPKATAEERIAELEATIERIKKNASKETKADPSPAPKSEPKAVSRELTKPTRPKLSDYDGSQGKTAEDYDNAMEKYFDDLSDFKADAKIREYQQRQTEEAGLRKLSSEIDEAKSRYDKFDLTTINDAAGEIWNDQQINPLVKDKLGKSELAIDLLYTLTGAEADYKAFLGLAKSDPVAAITKLAIMESAIREELKIAKGKATEDDKGKEAKGKAPQAAEPRAPKPPSEVGGRGTATEDAAIAAARAGDFRSFEAEQNRRLKASRS